MKNSKYWIKRFIQLENAQNKKGMDAMKEIEEIYRKAQFEIECNIAKWYQRFADNNNITLAEAKKLLSASDLAELKWDVNEYIRHGEQNAMTGQWVKELENASAKFHISKYEALKIKTQQSLESLYAKQYGIIKDTMEDVYKSGYYHTAFELQKGFEIGWDIAGINQRALEKVLSKPWAPDGKNFSERIWGSKQKLVNDLHRELAQGIMLGHDPQKTIDRLAKTINTSKNNIGRLVMTEEAFFSSAAQKDCFNDLGVEEYKIVATLDSHTSDICKSLDGKHFPMKDYQTGVNAPPFHVWCRSTTVPYFNDEFSNIGSRAARDKNGKTYYVPSTMTYKQWQKSFIDGDKSELKKVSLNDKINTGNINAQLRMYSVEADSLTKWIESLEGSEQEKWIKAFTETDYELFSEASNEISHFNPYENVVHLHSTDSALTVVHETAHAIDRGAIYRKVIEHVGDHNFEWEIRSASMNVQELSKPFIDSDIESIAKHIGVTADKGYFTCSDTDVFTGFSEYANGIISKFPDDELAFSCVSDIISGITNDLTIGSIMFGGHSKDYWQREVQVGEAFMVNVEAWANFCALKVSKNENMLSVLKDIVPGIYKALEQTYKEVFE